MSTCKISYNGNEISAVDETAPVSVAYNSATIATLNDGDAKTLSCHGKVMASDVVIGSKALNCNGKLMQGDIVVELAGSSASGKTWYFNDTIGYPDPDTLNVNFTSLNTKFIGIRLTGTGGTLEYILRNGRVFPVYDYERSRWKFIESRTIVLDEPATGDVLAFLEANATKLS